VVARFAWTHICALGATSRGICFICNCWRGWLVEQRSPAAPPSAHSISTAFTVWRSHIIAYRRVASGGALRIVKNKDAPLYDLGNSALPCLLAYRRHGFLMVGDISGGGYMLRMLVWHVLADGDIWPYLLLIIHDIFPDMARHMLALA